MFLRSVVSLCPIAAVAAVALAACGSSSSPSGSSSTSTAAASATGSTAASSSVPKAPSQSATESVINNYAPVGFTDSSGKLKGLDPQLGAVLGKLMGIDLTVKADAFENSMLGVQSGRVQLVPGASITPARLKTLNFVPYFTDSYRLAVLPKSQSIGSKLSDMCGLHIALVTGDTTVTYLQGYSKAHCGSKPINISTYPDGATIETALQTGRVQAWACATSACGYQSVKDGNIKVTGPKYAATTIGIASKKGTNWDAVVAAALRKAIQNGQYMAILKQYGIQSGAVPIKYVKPITLANYKSVPLDY